MCLAQGQQRSDAGDAKPAAFDAYDYPLLEAQLDQCLKQPDG